MECMIYGIIRYTEPKDALYMPCTRMLLLVAMLVENQDVGERLLKNEF